MTRFGIVITTYQRGDGKTPELLNRALKSILNQSHADWKVFLIGDRYEDDEEFQLIVENSGIHSDRIVAVNREEAAERDNYEPGSMQLWCAGGNVSSRYGISLALEDGIEYVCYLDHDDYWGRSHLLLFNEAIQKHPDVMVLASRSLYLRPGNVLPHLTEKTGYGWLPRPEGLIKSASCIKWSDTDVRPRDVFKETGETKPGDLDLWQRLNAEMKATGRKGFLVPDVTCSHLEEHHTLRSGNG